MYMTLIRRLYLIATHDVRKYGFVTCFQAENDSDIYRDCMAAAQAIESLERKVKELSFSLEARP